MPARRSGGGVPFLVEMTKLPRSFFVTCPIVAFIQSGWSPEGARTEPVSTLATYPPVLQCL